ncbi:MAG: hypothetical protein GC152_03880 [Alphaproteobacteria bacterium]|nr:hypothetical protein [Alphaproteobacteria bacterium]
MAKTCGLNLRRTPDAPAADADPGALFDRLCELNDPKQEGPADPAVQAMSLVILLRELRRLRTLRYCLTGDIVVSRLARLLYALDSVAKRPCQTATIDGNRVIVSLEEVRIVRALASVLAGDEPRARSALRAISDEGEGGPVEAAVRSAAAALRRAGIHRLDAAALVIG